MLLTTPALPFLQVADVVVLTGEMCKGSWPRHCLQKAPPHLLLFCPLLPSTALHILFKLSRRKSRASAWSGLKVAKFTPYSTMPANKYWGQYWPLWYHRLSNLALLDDTLLCICHCCTEHILLYPLVVYICSK